MPSFLSRSVPVAIFISSDSYDVLPTSMLLCTHNTIIPVLRILLVVNLRNVLLLLGTEANGVL